MVRFIVLRHGCSVFNGDRIFSGQRDVALNAVGVKQAEIVKKYVVEKYKIDKIYSSDLSRALNTVKPIADAFCMDVEKMKELRELDVGEWEGKTISEIEKLYPETVAVYKANVGRFSPEGGESYADLVKRSKETLDSLALKNDGKTVLVSTHGTFIRCLYCALSGIGLDDIKNIPHVPNASVSVIDYVDGVGRFVEYGTSEYLCDLVTDFKIV